MSILYDPEKQIYTLQTRNSSYQLRIGPLGYLLHLYYGRRCTEDFTYLHLPRDCGFSPNPREMDDNRGFSLDTFPQEYSGSNGGDYRLPSLRMLSENGIPGADLRVVRHEIRKGKAPVPGLPSAFDHGKETESLSVTLRDAATGLEAELLYAVFESTDMITRSVCIRNAGTHAVRLDKAASACLDLPFGEWDCIHFHGRHTMERIPERIPVGNGIFTVSSARGASGHQENPFVILCDRETGEMSGECYGFMLCYSGNHQTEIEKDQTGSVRVVAGIGERNFSWLLSPGEQFDTPEVFLSFSAEGLTHLSHNYHAFLRGNVCRSRWTEKRRPILLNSWETLYFDLNEEKLLSLAREAKQLDMEMLVLDDGWFGERRDDTRALGDWTENRDKLPSGLPGLIEKISAEGLSFGIWIEPEMVSEDSRLYRSHPDWALRVPGRSPAYGRSQLVLDLSRTEVADWVFETISALLRSNQIAYVKWDMNRSLSDVRSSSLPPERQGEVPHRYMLGLYRILERLTGAFPDVLFEGCAGGGGRFDAGMLAYFPQIWCSDNTDPIARLSIQEGTSYGYPLSAVGAHVSASPNHQTGRSTPLGTRAVTAMAGCFGYELNPALLSEAEKKEIREQVRLFRRLSDLVLQGAYYRLTPPQAGLFTAWQTVSGDGKRTLLSLVVKNPEGNPRPLHLRLRGLHPEAKYRLAEEHWYGCRPAEDEKLPGTLSGEALMSGGLTIPRLFGDYPSVQLLFERV